MWNILNYKVPTNKKDVELDNNVGQLEDIAYAPSDLSGAKEKATKNHTTYPTMRLIAAAALIMAPVLGLSCRTSARVEEPTPAVAPRDYTIEDLKAALGAVRWNSLDNEQRAEFENEWGKAKGNIKRFMVDVYNDPQKIYGGFSEDEKRRFDAFKVSDLDKKRVSEYRKAFPWINTEQPTLADKLVVDGIELGAYLSGLR